MTSLSIREMLSVGKIWIFNTKVWSWMYIYIGTTFTMIYLTFKHKFNFDKITMNVDMMTKDMRYQLKKAKEENIRLTRELDEKITTKRL